MAVPQLLPTVKQTERVGSLTYHIEGELVPVLQVELDAGGIYFEHHILLWKDSNVEVEIKPLKGLARRMLAGLPLIMIEAKGSGRIAFSRDGAGHVFPLHLQSGEKVEVREHQFLAATNNLAYSFSRIKGIANMLLGNSGLFIDTFKNDGSQEAVLWLHGYGNVFELTLQSGESIDIEPGGWIYKEDTVRMDTTFQRLSAGLFGSAAQLCWNRFTGPGRIAFQSMSQSWDKGGSRPAAGAKPAALALVALGFVTFAVALGLLFLVFRR